MLATTCILESLYAKFFAKGYGLLVFIIAIGYFITPELVGGKDGQMIGNWIAYHLKTINWGLWLLGQYYYL